MTANPLRVGVVGTGRWAVRSHIPGWQRDPRAEVVALSDVDPDVAGRGGRGVRRRADRPPTTASWWTTRTSTSSTS